MCDFSQHATSIDYVNHLKIYISVKLLTWLKPPSFLFLFNVTPSTFFSRLFLLPSFSENIYVCIHFHFNFKFFYFIFFNFLLFLLCLNFLIFSLQCHKMKEKNSQTVCESSVNTLESAPHQIKKRFWGNLFQWDVSTWIDGNQLTTSIFPFFFLHT